MQEDGESSTVQRILDGDVEALGALRERLHSQLSAALIARGARRAEAADLLADLWSDCVPKGAEGVSLLEKYHGRSPLPAWLGTVVTHRWVDSRRRAAKCAGSLDETVFLTSASGPEAMRTERLTLVDSALSGMIQTALQEAFAGLRVDALVMLRLVHLHGLTQRELGRMWGWHETRVSRHLQRNMKRIRDLTLAGLATRDPWLKLEWEDLVEVCAQAEGCLFPR